MIKHLKKKFPDVCKQVLEMDKIYSRADTEKKVAQFSESFGQGVIAYEQIRKKINVYTSRIFMNKLESMKKGDPVLDSNAGKVGIISSDKPFFCGCSLCIRVDFGDTSDVYDCAYFM